MLRTALCFVALSLLVSSIACKKKDDASDKAGSSAKKKSGDDEHGEESADEDKPKGKGEKGCKLADRITADFSVTSDCKTKVKGTVTVDEGATLTIEAGAKLSFDAEAELMINHGKLVAKGTDDAPIVFTSSSSTPAAGDWQGILFDQKTSSGVVLDHVKIEYAGKGGWSRGAITVYGEVSPGRITITNSTFKNNATAAIANEHDKSTFAKVEGNTFKDNGGHSLSVSAAVLASVGANKFSEPVTVHGNVTKSGTWPKTDQPFLIEQNLELRGEGSAAILTLPEKAVLKFKAATHLWIGGGDGGGVVAKGVTFTSANATPADGDWEGIFIDEKATSTTFEDCIIEYAGQGGWSKAAVTYYGGAPSKFKNVKFKNCKFRHNEHGAFHPHEGHDCGPLAEDNKSEGKPVCVKAD
jgi:hypothetical protein